MKDNKLIAEFMGHKLGLDGDGMGDPQSRIFEKGLGTQRIEDTYSKSWDWLMPVIDKCYQEHMSKHIADAVMTCDKDKAYQAVIEFINEYNKTI